MRAFIYRAHIWLGLIVAIPVLAWASSGLLYAWPSAVEGGKIESIAAPRVQITPVEAMRRADAFAGRKLPTTALTLLMRDGRPVYQAVGGMGADSLLIDAETGEVVKTPPPGVSNTILSSGPFLLLCGELAGSVAYCFISSCLCVSLVGNLFKRRSLANEIDEEASSLGIT
jgi:hypothetical protein